MKPLMPLIFTRSSIIVLFFHTLVPVNKYSSFSDPLLETWQALVIFQMVKKCLCPGRRYVTGIFWFLGTDGAPELSNTPGWSSSLRTLHALA